MNALIKSQLMNDQSCSAARNIGTPISNGRTNPDRIDSGNNCTNGSIVRNTVLRSSLLGEYVSLLMMCHSLFGVVCWATHLLQNPASLIMSTAGLWIAFRAVGGFAGDRWATIVSALLLLLTGTLAITGVSNVPLWLSGSLVAPIVWTVMLGLLLVVEFFDCRKKYHTGLSVPEKRKKDSTSLKLALAGLFFAWGLGVPTVTLIHQLSRPSPGKVQLEEMSFIEHAGFRCGEALVTACFFALGCNIGSFLNVVVWRMPLGKSIVHGDSRCPVCSAAITKRDNIPIFGWLGLGGQCRACSTNISPRYPIVEAITGSVFLLFYFVELISGGANLPVRGINMYRGVLWIIMYPKWDLIGLYLYHCFLFCVLLVLALMATDRSRIPGRLLLFVFAVAILLTVVFPTLALVPVWPAIQLTSAMAPALNVACGAVAGLMIGWALRWAWREDSRYETSELFSVVPAFGMIGIVLGWQAALSIMTFLCVLMVTRLMVIGRSDQLINCLFAAVLIHHLIWRTMLQWSGEVWPHASSTMTCVILPLAIYLLAVVVIRRNSLCFPKNYQRTA